MLALGFLDDKNINLWNYLQSIHKIKLEGALNDEYSVYSVGDTSTIFIPSEINSASFTHELLHILMKAKGINIGGCIKNLTRSDAGLIRIFSDQLIDHLSNCLEHIKMLPEFLILGYQAEDFLMNFDTNKLKTEDIKLLKSTYSQRHFLSRKYNSRAIDCFIGAFFAAKTCPNQSINYSKSLRKLKKIDKNLYNILEKFMYEWESLDIDRQDGLSSYRDVAFDFYTEMKKWTLKKIII